MGIVERVYAKMEESLETHITFRAYFKVPYIQEDVGELMVVIRENRTNVYFEYRTYDKLQTVNKYSAEVSHEASELYIISDQFESIMKDLEEITKDKVFDKVDIRHAHVYTIMTINAKYQQKEVRIGKSLPEIFEYVLDSIRKEKWKWIN